MKLLKKDENVFRFIVESVEDLWHLFEFIERGDFVISKSKRKIKKEDSKKIEIKTILVKLQVEKKELNDAINDLKILGPIVESSTEVHGYHSIHITIGSDISVIKNTPINHYLLNKMLISRNKSIMLGCLFDNHNAIIFEILSEKVNILEELNIEFDKSQNIVRFEELFKILTEYVNKKNYEKIILGFSVFWKNNIEEVLTKYNWKEKAIIVNINNPTRNGIFELLQSSELESLLKDFKITEDTKIVNEIRRRLYKNEKIEYGKNVLEVVNTGAVDTLILPNDVISDAKIRELMQKVEKMNGKIYVVDTDDAKKLIKNLGNLVAFLRFDICN